MGQLEDRYIGLLTDFGFERIFCTALNKELLISFLNSILDGKQIARNVTYLNNEHLGDGYQDRSGILDVYCKERTESASSLRYKTCFSCFSRIDCLLPPSRSVKSLSRAQYGISSSNMSILSFCWTSTWRMRLFKRMQSVIVWSFVISLHIRFSTTNWISSM